MLEQRQASAAIMPPVRSRAIDFAAHTIVGVRWEKASEQTELFQKLHAELTN